MANIYYLLIDRRRENGTQPSETAPPANRSIVKEKRKETLAEADPSPRALPASPDDVRGDGARSEREEKKGSDEGSHER